METPERKARILWVGNRRVKGGISVVTERFIQDERIHARYQVKIQDQSFSGEINEHPLVKVFKLPWGVAQIIWNCILFRPDIVHIHSPYYNYGFIKDGLIALLAHLFGKKVILTFHPGNSLIEEYHQAPTLVKKWTDFVLPRCDVLVALGKSYQEFMATQFQHPHVVVIPNPVDDEMAANAPHNYGQRAPIVFFAGLFTQRKGAYDLIRAIDRVKLDEVRFIIKGGSRSPAETRQFQQIYDHCQSRDKIQLEEWGPVAEPMSRARLLVLPSHGESLPVILIEALACGLPVVTTPVGVIPDYVQDGVHGLLVKPGDLDGLAEAIEFVLVNQEWAASIAQSNREYGKRFLRSRVHAQLIQLYDRLLEK